MALPKINYPTFLIEDPSEKKKYTFRPMLVKDEKLLLMAKSSEDSTDILTSIKQVVNNCALDESFNVDKLPLYSLQYMFIRLRSHSIGEQIKVSYKDYEDEKIYDFNIDLNNITIKMPENALDNKIFIEPTSGIVLKYPSADIYDDKEFLKTTAEESFYKLIVRCIDQVFDATNAYDGKEFKEEDLLEFIEMIDIKTFEKIKEFISNLPSLYYKIEYKNSLNNLKTIELTTLSDFFTLR